MNRLIRQGSLVLLALLIMASMGSRMAEAQTEPSAAPAKAAVSDFVRQGDSAFAEGNYQAAADAYSQALALYNLNDYIYYNRGNAYRKLKDYAKAIDDYSKTLQLNPQHTFAYLYRGMSYQALGQSETAIADYNKLMQVNPDDPTAYARRAEAYLSLNQKAAAIEDFTKASELYKKLEESELSEKMLSQVRSLK